MEIVKENRHKKLINKLKAKKKIIIVKYLIESDTIL